MFKERSKLLTLLAMCFALFMAMLDNTVVNVALPKIQGSLGSGVSGLQWIVDAYVLMFASVMLTGGTLGDLFGRKRMFLTGLTVFTVASFLCVVAESKHPEGRHVDLPGQLLAIGWLGALTYSLIEGNAQGWRSPMILTLLSVAAAGLLAFLLVERRSTSPMLQLSFFRNRTFSA